MDLDWADFELLRATSFAKHDEIYYNLEPKLNQLKKKLWFFEWEAGGYWHCKYFVIDVDTNPRIWDAEFVKQKMHQAGYGTATPLFEFEARRLAIEEAKGLLKDL